MGAIVQAFGAIQQGNATAAADKERALELKQQAKLVQTQATEQMASRMDTLNRSVGVITALTASRLLNTASPSAQAYLGQQKRVADVDASTIGANAAIQGGMLNESARAALLAADNATQQSWFSALGIVDSAAAQAFAAGG